MPINGRFLAVRRLWPRSGVRRTETLVLLHEGLGCIEMWRCFPEQLALRTGCSVVLYDRLGYGRSDEAAGPWDSFYLHRAALEELPLVLDRLGVETPVLVGHSDGGTIALIHAARHRVKAVVTLAAHIWVEQAAVDGVAMAEQAWNDGRIEDRLARYHGDKTRKVFFSWAETWQADWFRSWSIADLLPGIRCPIQVVQGLDDEYATSRHPREIVSRAGGAATLLLIPGCGHSPHRDAEPQTLDAVESLWRCAG